MVMREERSVVLYPSVNIFPKTIHLSITTFLILNPGLWIHLSNLGISSVEEIVTTFIKAEEQNISLFNYVNMLNSEIDMIEEQNKNIEAEI